MNKNNKKQTAAQKLFASYTIYITDIMLEEYGPSYATRAEIRNTWRYKIPYTNEIENFLIFKTKMYIRLLDTRDSNSTNPQFLDALTQLMADYLSAYTMHNPEKLSRKKAKEILKQALYDNSAYIQSLLEHQEIMRELRDKRKNSTYKKPSRNKQRRQQDTKRKFQNIKQQNNCKIIEIKIKQR